jgi:dipeptidyl aminopeptidase/acylaminoacyl peptidase
VAGVIAVASFSDVETVARERAPFFASAGQVTEALALAEREAKFPVAEASPRKAAPRIRVPVLLIHGAEDDETPPDHSRRIHDALGGPKELLLVEGAGHGDALRPQAWQRIEAFLERVSR